MPRKRRIRKYKRRRRGGNILHPPGGPPVDVPNIAVPPNIIPVMPAAPVQYRRPKMGPLTQVKAFLKRHRVISRGLNAVGARSLGNRVYQMGYGRSGGCRF